MPSVQTFLPWRLVILAWLTMWIATLPLFHIHVPDATDRWSTLQSGGAHTVFSPDLPGEYSHPFHDNQQRRSSHVSNRVVNSPELGIVVLEDPDNRKVKRLHVLGAQFIFSDASLQPRHMWVSPEKSHHLQLFQAFPVSRAPPRIV